MSKKQVLILAMAVVMVLSFIAPFLIAFISSFAASKSAPMVPAASQIILNLFV